MHSVRDFCAATRGLDKIRKEEESLRPLRAENRDLKRLIMQDMLDAKSNCMPVMHKGKQMYAVLKETRRLPPLTPETVVSVISEIREADLRSEMTFSPSLPFPELVEACLARKLKTRGETSRTLCLRTRPPSQEERRPPPSRVVDAIGRMEENKVCIKKRRESILPRKKPLQETVSHVQAAVAEHLKRVDPVHAEQTVTLQEDGKVGTFSLRRKERTKRKAANLKSVLPVARKVLTNECARLGIRGEVGAALQRLQSEDSLSALRERLASEFESIASPTQVVSVTLREM